MAAQRAHFDLDAHLAIALCCVAGSGLGSRTTISTMWMALSSTCLILWMHVVIRQVEIEKREAEGGSMIKELARVLCHLVGGDCSLDSFLSRPRLDSLWPYVQGGYVPIQP